MGGGKSSSASVIHQDRIPRLNSCSLAELPPLHSGQQSHPKSNPRSDLWASRSREKLHLSYFLPGTIASLAAFATRIFTTVLAGILIAHQ